jgi:hypothetical protein
VEWLAFQNTTRPKTFISKAYGPGAHEPTEPSEAPSSGGCPPSQRRKQTQRRRPLFTPLSRPVTIAAQSCLPQTLVSRTGMDHFICTSSEQNGAGLRHDVAVGFVPHPSWLILFWVAPRVHSENPGRRSRTTARSGCDWQPARSRGIRCPGYRHVSRGPSREGRRPMHCHHPGHPCNYRANRLPPTPKHFPPCRTSLGPCFRVSLNKRP